MEWRVIWQYDLLFGKPEINIDEFETEQQADAFIESLEMNEFVGLVDKEPIEN